LNQSANICYFGRLISESKAFVELDEGKGKYHVKYRRASKVYGLTGEAMLNFGLLGAPIIWLLFGFVVGWIRRKSDTFSNLDSRWAAMPLVTYWMLNMPRSDLDNFIFGFFRSGLIPLVCIYLWSYKVGKIYSKDRDKAG